MRRRAGALALAALLVTGCGTLSETPVEPWVRAEARRPAGDSESLLMYFEHVRKLPAAALAREHDVVRPLYSKEGRSDFTRVRYAMLLSVPGAAVSDDARALELLDPLLKNPGAALHGVAYAVSTQIQEQRRASALQQKIAEEQKRSLALQSRLEDEQKRATGLQQRYDEEQKRATGLQQRYDEEQKRAAGLQQKLEALRTLEKSLIERDQGAAGRRR